MSKLFAFYEKMYYICIVIQNANKYRYVHFYIMNHLLYGVPAPWDEETDEERMRREDAMHREYGD